MTSQLKDLGKSVWHSDEQEIKPPKFWVALLREITMCVVVGLVGAALAFVFWGIWSLISGSMPAMWGIDRIWLDMVGLAVSFILSAYYFIDMGDKRDELESRWECDVSTKELFAEHPVLVWKGIGLVATFVAGLIWNFVAGFAGMFVVLVVWLLWKVIATFFLFAGNSLFSNMNEVAGESSESFES